MTAPDPHLDSRRPEAPAAFGAMPVLSHRQILTVLVGLMLGLLVAALSQTIVATALPTIVGELGGQEQLAWVVSATLLASTVSTPVWGKLSDLHGRKIMFQSAIGLFLVASLAAGFAQNMAQLIGARGIQGLGVGGVMALPKRSSATWSVPESAAATKATSARCSAWPPWPDRWRAGSWWSTARGGGRSGSASRSVSWRYWSPSGRCGSASPAAGAPSTGSALCSSSRR